MYVCMYVCMCIIYTQIYNNMEKYIYKTMKGILLINISCYCFGESILIVWQQ